MVRFLNPNGTIKQGEYQYVHMVVGANITAVCFWFFGLLLFMFFWECLNLHIVVAVP